MPVRYTIPYKNGPFSDLETFWAARYPLRPRSLHLTMFLARGARIPMPRVLPTQLLFTSTRGAVSLCWLLIVAAVTSGCVQRRMTIRSDPPGALVYVDDYEIGNTPVSTDFVYYGTRKIRLVKDGYETLTVRQPFPMPWYQIFPLDFVTENVWPGEIRDERNVSLTMVPAASMPADQVVARAELSRAQARALPGATTPPPAPQVPPAPQAVTPQAIPAQPLPPPMVMPQQQPAYPQQPVFPQQPLPPPQDFPPPGYVPPSGGPNQPGGF